MDDHVLAATLGDPGILDTPRFFIESRVHPEAGLGLNAPVRIPILAACHAKMGDTAAVLDADEQRRLSLTSDRACVEHRVYHVAPVLRHQDRIALVAPKELFSPMLNPSCSHRVMHRQVCHAPPERNSRAPGHSGRSPARDTPNARGLRRTSPSRYH